MPIEVVIFLALVLALLFGVWRAPAWSRDAARTLMLGYAGSPRGREPTPAELVSGVERRRDRLVQGARFFVLQAKSKWPEVDIALLEKSETILGALFDAGLARSDRSKLLEDVRNLRKLAKALAARGGCPDALHAQLRRWSSELYGWAQVCHLMLPQLER